MIVFLSVCAAFHLPHRCCTQLLPQTQKKSPYFHHPHINPTFSTPSFFPSYFFPFCSFLSFSGHFIVCAKCRKYTIKVNSPKTHSGGRIESRITRIKQCRSARTLYFTLNWLHIKILPYFSF